MVIELDEVPNAQALKEIRFLPWVRTSHQLDKVSA
jgi:hypothetical protein